MPEHYGGSGRLPWPAALLLLVLPGVPELRTVVAQPGDIIVQAPEHLRVEGLLEPVAVISEPSPRFSFLHGDIRTGGFGFTQASYRIQVADADSGTPLWDSGDVKSSNCSQIVYAGKALPSFTRFAWTVEWMSSTGARSAPATAIFETGPMKSSDWQGAGWLTGANSQLRNDFEVAAHKKVAYARAYVAAAGCAHIEVNGRVPQPDHRGICPWPVDFSGVRYITHDITDLVMSGKNAFGMVLGNVMKGPQAAILVIIKHKEDPTPTFALSSSSSGWMATAPYVTTSTAWDASVDWTKREPGWSMVGFTFGPGWNATTVMPARPRGYGVPARALAMPLSTVLGEVKPVSVDKLPAGSFLYTFPKNFVGTVQFKPLPAAATGSNLTVLLGEWLVPTDPGVVPPDTGEFKPSPSSMKNTYPKISVGHNGYNGYGGQQYENHVLRMGNTDPISTLFCWHGFQYVRVTPGGDTGFTGALDAIVGLEIHTNVSKVGSLAFGGEGNPAAEDAAEVLAHINQMTLQSQRSNVAAYIPTDCPTREKHGWMGDWLDASEQAFMNFEIAPVYEAFMQTIQDNQSPLTGDVPFKVPAGQHYGNISCADIAWTSAYPQITSMLYQYYGDTKTLERRYPSLVRYIENLISHAYSVTSNAHAGLAVCDNFRDWLCGNAQSCCTDRGSPSCPVGAEMGGFNYVLALRSMSKMAAVLGNSSAAARYEALASSGTKEFHAYFFNETVGRYGGDEGAIQSLSLPALEIGSPPASVYPNVVKTVGNDMKAIDYTMAVGAVTSKIVFNVLSENGMHEAALRAAINTEEPSIGHWWKRWNATTCYEAFPGANSANQTSSLNHIFLCGGISHWMWKHLVGLTPAAPGFAEVSITPRIHDSIGPRSVGGQFVSPKGRILSSWTLTDAGIVTLSVSLPVGVNGATIVVPKPTREGKPSATAIVKLGGTVIWDGAQLVGEPAGIEGATDQLHGVSFETTNGVFEFESVAK